MGLERRPGNDPGFRGCAAPVCPLHSARVDGLVCPGTPVGSRHRKIRKGVVPQARESNPVPGRVIPRRHRTPAMDRGERIRTALLGC